MQIIKAKTASRQYFIYVGAGIISRLGFYLKQHGFTDRAIIITNPIVNELYGSSIKTDLLAEGLEAAILLVPDGEKYKSLENAAMLYKKISELGADRRTPVIAVGGGVIGDLAGFVAATYMRGLPLVQVPTTLLAQVDSSIGGKVAINHEKIKNKIGAFYQPDFVLSDTQTLNTLPDNQLSNGLAEIIKYAVIRDRTFFKYIERNVNNIKSRQPEALERTIARCAKIKARVVARDERDTGLRNILNFGHTVGHAIESTSDFNLGHGEAVSIGMTIAGRISRNAGLLSQRELNDIIRLIEKAGLPVKLPELDAGRVIEVIRQDKKIISGRIRFILAKSIGNAIISDRISPADIEKALVE